MRLLPSGFTHTITDVITILFPVSGFSPAAISTTWFLAPAKRYSGKMSRHRVSWLWWCCPFLSCQSSTNGYLLLNSYTRERGASVILNYSFSVSYISCSFPEIAPSLPRWMTSQWLFVNIGSDNGSVPSDNKLFPEPYISRHITSLGYTELNMGTKQVVSLKNGWWNYIWDVITNPCPSVDGYSAQCWC